MQDIRFDQRLNVVSDLFNLMSGEPMPESENRSRGSSHPIVDMAYLVREGLFGLLFIVFTGSVIIYIDSSYDADIAAYYCVGIVIAGSFTGYVIGGIISKMREDRIKINGRAGPLAEIDGQHSAIMGSFCNITITLTCFYIIFYFAAMAAMADNLDKGSNFPVDIKVLLLSAVTIGFFGSFSVLYAAYVRMTKRLELALKSSAREQNRDLIQLLRDAVFRGEHLYEPPGNIFVTVGITATFMGLSVGLVILDMPSLLGPAGDINAVDPAVGGPQPAGSGPGSGRGNALASLTAFVGCMGLALGMSMLGVSTAMAAQWLRGLGANKNIEDLLELADDFLAPAEPRSGDPGRGGARGPDLRKPAVGGADESAGLGSGSGQNAPGQVLPDAKD